MFISRSILRTTALTLSCVPLALAQSDPGKPALAGKAAGVGGETAAAGTSTTTVAKPSFSGCQEAPREDALISMCAPPAGGAEDAAPVPMAMIALAIPAGTPLRIELDQRVRIDHTGDVVHGKVVEAVYAFDQVVIPEGSIATGRVIKIDGVPTTKRILAYSNGNLTPFHKYEITFDMLTLPDGKQLPIQTTVSQGSAQVVHLVSNPNKQEQKAATGKAEDRAKQEAKGKIQDAKDQVHDGWAQLTRPGKMHRVKQLLIEQMPYRRQYVEPGTRFAADLDKPLSFGDTSRTGPQLATVGSEPVPDSVLKARLVAEVSSATASRGTPVTALLTEPLYSPSHELILPANTRLVGQVLRAKPAGKLHHNGELRVIFERIETPEEAVRATAQINAQEQARLQEKEREQAEASDAQVSLQRRSQAMIGNLEGVEVDRAANMKLDEEGGARTTDSKSRYLSTGLAVMIAAAASHTDAERGSVDAAGDPGVRTVSGASGSRLTGALLSLVIKSTPVSIAFGAYGASSSIYSNFLSRGHDVVFPKDTPVEIGFGTPHAAQSEPKK
jgi:hypothetical protein